MEEILRITERLLLFKVCHRSQLDVYNAWQFSRRYQLSTTQKEALYGDPTSESQKGSVNCIYHFMILVKVDTVCFQGNLPL